MTNPTSRNDFCDTWLAEMPSGLGSFETYDALVYSIKQLKKIGKQPEKVTGDLYKIELSNSVYYWYEKHNQILLGTQLEKKPQGLVVSVTGKHPSLRKSPPFASDLYDRILKDTNSNIRILGDTQLSDQGYAIWKNLFSKGHWVGVYNTNEPGKSFEIFQTQQQMDKYFKDDDTDYRRYQFVLSSQKNLAECLSNFNIRRYRELARLSLED
jgi:hypothetical protein